MRLFTLVGFGTLAVLANGFIERDFQRVNPQTYVSSSGHYKLRINPDDEYATKGAKYRLTLDDKVVWERHFPFALLRAGVTDEGGFGGYACGAEFGDGQITVAIGTKEGKLLLTQSTHRRPSRMVDSASLPVPRGFIFDSEHDRMIVRAFDPEIKKRGEQWWTYRLSDGRPGTILTPQTSMPAEATWIVDARPLPGTPLTVLSWWHYDTKAGAILTLVDANAKPIWRLDMDGDYEGGKDEYVRATKTNEFQRTGSILAVSEKHFEIRRVQEQLKVSYAVERIGEKWKITESGRQPYSPPAAPVFRNPAIAPATLSLLRKWKIPLSPVNASPIQDVEDFEVAGGKWLAVLRGGNVPALAVTDQEGRNPRSVPLPKIKEVGGGNGCLAWLGKDRFLVTKTKSYRPNRTSAWIVDVLGRRVTSLVIPGKVWIKSIAGFGDGGFVALQSEDHAYSSTESLAVYDRNGKVTWQSGNGGGYGGGPEELLSPEDVAVDPSGRIVVLDNITHTLQFFSKQGKYLDRIQLDKVWKKAAEYPTQIRCVGSGFLIWDTSVGYRLDSKGRIVEKILPRLANSKPLYCRFDPQSDEKDRIWISDGDALYRLDRKGRFERKFGGVQGLQGLHKVAALVITPNGTSFAYDAGSDELHAFDFGGRRKFAARPLPRDLKDSEIRFQDPVSIDDLGRIYMDYGTGLVVRFSALGKREASITPTWEKSGPPPAVWKKGWWWRGARLMDSNGKTVTTIHRLPNDDWLSWLNGPISVSPDGRLAIVESGDSWRQKTKVKVGFYSPTGVPETTAEIQWDPEELRQFAYDGRLVYFPRGKDLLAFDKNGKPTWRFILPVRQGANWQAFPFRDGIAMYDGIDTVYWYRLPSALAGKTQDDRRFVETRSNHDVDLDGGAEPGLFYHRGFDQPSLDN